MEADAKKYLHQKFQRLLLRKDDLLFCGASHLFIAHEKCAGKWAEVLQELTPTARQLLNIQRNDLPDGKSRFCLEFAEQSGAESIAFCCISTGEFHFPNDEAAKIAVKVVNEYKCRTKSEIEVIFNVFKDEDYEICKELLRAD